MPVPSIMWTGEPGDTRSVTSQAFDDTVARLAAMCAGARVAVVLPPSPELAVALSACNQPLMIHPLEIPDRIDADFVITSSALVYRGDLIFLKERVDAIFGGSVLVHDRTGWMPLGATLDVYHDVPMKVGRDVWFPKIEETDEHPTDLVEAPPLRAVVEGRSQLPDEPFFLYEGYLEAEDADRARAAYVGASGTRRGSRPGGRLS